MCCKTNIKPVLYWYLLFNLCAGSVQDTETEIARLTHLAAELQAGEAAAAAVTAVASDNNGSLLRLLLRWREMRQLAVDRQIQLLQQRAEKLKSGVVETPEDGFMHWLKNNNAVVSFKDASSTY